MIVEDKDWRPDNLQTLDFEDGSEVISFFDENINKGAVVLHPWQVEENERLAKAKPTSKDPYKYVLCAANGSGKDAFVIAPFALWFILTKVSSLVLITSASGVQLSSQTEKYIRQIASKINAFYKNTYGTEIIKIRQRYFKCLLSGSEIQMFATDEEGRAEGYHPLEPDAEFAIIVNEAKTVSPEIFRALRRCTGYNYWINVSTPGPIPAGDFYKSWISWTHKKRVTYFDCPHQSPVEFEADRKELGEHSALFRSKWLALFTTAEGDTIIPSPALEALRNRITSGGMYHRCSHWPIRVGIDLAGGGDEIVVSVFRGNKQLGLHHWRERDSVKSVQAIDRILHEEYRLPKDHDFIFADDGGIGRAIIDQLRQKGWLNIHRILNQSKARNTNLYRNRGAELWYNFRRLVEECIVWLIDDEKQWSQLQTRRYKKEGDSAAVSKIQLESKASAKGDGLPSPDRADATILAFCGVTYKTFLDDELRIDETTEKLNRRKVSNTNVETYVDDLIYSDTFGNELVERDSIKGSLAVLLKQNANLNSFPRSRN